MLEIQSSPHLRKKWHRFPCILYFVIHLNCLGTGALEFGRGSEVHSYYLLALRLLDQMGFAMVATTELKIGRGTLQPTALGLRISIPNFRVLFGTGRGHKVFYPPRPDYRRFKIPSFTCPNHTHRPVCAPTATFSFSRIVDPGKVGREQSIS